MKLALTLLCENPVRKTGLSSLFVELVWRSLNQFPDLEWLVYVAPEHDWPVEHERLTVVKNFPGSNNMKRRLYADHFKVGPDAAKRGADALVTVGFSPIRRAGLPVAMHMLSLQHLSEDNAIGYFRSLYRNWAAASGMRKADMIITNTEFAIAQILEVNPEIRGKIVQSYEGLQHEFYNPDDGLNEVAAVKEKFGVDPGYLYWCSNFYPYKQAEKFFNAYALLTEEEKTALPIVMVGGGGWGDGLESAMVHARKLDIEKHIAVLGWVDDHDLAMLYRQAKIFVLASREETFGRCVIEAMACGIPCVVNDIPVMHEVTGGHAMVVNFDHPEEVALRFRTLLGDKGSYEKLAQAGILNAKRFDFDFLSKERVNAIAQMVRSKVHN